MSGMKLKTIKRVLHNQLTNWVNSIDEPRVRDIAKVNVFVTGGSIASMLLGEKIKDFDVYFRTKESAFAVAQYYVDRFNDDNGCSLEVREAKVENIKGELEERIMIWIRSVGVVESEDFAGMCSKDQDENELLQQDNASGEDSDELIEDALGCKKADMTGEGAREKFRPVFMSQNAITLTGKMQLVIRFFGEPEDIYENYDFQHVCQAYTYHDNKLHTDKAALESLITKTLYYQGSLYPVASFFRTKKFIERGWKVSAGQMMKIVWQISHLNLHDIKVLREQLTGVDALYMHAVIRQLMESEAGTERPEGMEDHVDGSYLMKILDEVFGDRVL